MELTDREKDLLDQIFTASGVMDDTWCWAAADCEDNSCAHNRHTRCVERLTQELDELREKLNITERR